MPHVKVGSLIIHVFFENEYMLVVEDAPDYFIVVDLTDRAYYIERTEIYKDFITWFEVASDIFVEEV